MTPQQKALKRMLESENTLRSPSSIAKLEEALNNDGWFLVQDKDKDDVERIQIAYQTLLGIKDEDILWLVRKEIASLQMVMDAMNRGEI